MNEKAPTVTTVSTAPEGQVGSRIGMEVIVASLIQLLAATQSEDAQSYLKLLRELAFDRLNSTSLDGLSTSQAEAVFRHARETIKTVFDPSLLDTSRGLIDS